MISKLFLLIIAILIILGLYCSDSPIKLEQFNNPNLTSNKTKLSNNIYAPSHNLNEGGLSLKYSNNQVSYYDPEDKVVCGADYKTCNNTDLPIKGCVSNYNNNTSSSNLRRDPIIETYESSTPTEIKDGASQIFGKDLILMK